MEYIIDANNLAGKLNLLEKINFDKKLINIIKKWSNKKNKKAMLVFDSSDPMGDKYSDGKITIIYTPKDNYYKSADDKIIELAEQKREKNKNGLIIITDDIEIKNKIEKLNTDYQNKKIKIKSSKTFASELENIINKEKEENKGSLNNNEINAINKELLKKWS